MPDEFLDGLDPDERGRQWQAFAERPSPGTIAVVADDDRDVVGFALVGQARGLDDDRIGELHAINVDPGAWGSGAGTALLAAATDHLRALGYTNAFLWVVDGNARARRFYEREGWLATPTEKTEELQPGVTITEVRYECTL
jgi:GNAT superfamily N-acetyltransferase